MPPSDRNLEALARCADVRGLLPALVEDEVDGATAGRVAGHLAICAACRAEESQVRAALGLLRQARPVPAPVDLHSGFAARRAAAGLRRDRVQRRLRLAAGAACALLVVAGGATVARHILVPAPRLPSQAAVAGAAPSGPTLPPGLPALASRPPVPGPVPGPGAEPPPVLTQPEAAGALPVQPSVSARPAGASAPRRPRRYASSARRTGEHPTRPTMLADANDFLGVRPLQGMTAAGQFRLAARANQAAFGAAAERQAGGGAPTTDDARPDALAAPAAERPQVATVVPEIDEHVSVQGRVTRVQAAAGYDRDGRRVLVKVDIGAENGLRRPAARPD